MLRNILLGPTYLGKKRMITRTEFLPTEALAKYQTDLLGGVLLHALEHIPFYQNVLNCRNVASEKDILTRLSYFPIIDKKTIRMQCEAFMKASLFRQLKATSGGSTGQPFVFYMDRFVTRQREKAFIFDLWGRVGYRFGDAIFNLRGRTPKKGSMVHHDRLFNIYYASSFDLNTAKIEDYISAINRIRPRFLHGYPSTMYQLAILMEAAKKRLQFQVTAVLCGSEKLFPYQKTKIEKVFGCRVYHWYGHSECLALGGACEYSDVLHFYPQYGYTELLPAGVTDDRGRELFEIVATGFNNPVMPLLRYRTGDYAVLAETQSCRCGRNYLLIDEIVGRQQEFIVDVNGYLISATSLIFGQHYEAFGDIASIKLHQQKIGAITVILVKGKDFREELYWKMQNHMRELIGDRMTINFKFSDAVEKTPIGKAKLVEQELDMREFLPTDYVHEKRKEIGMTNKHENNSEAKSSVCSNLPRN